MKSIKRSDQDHEKDAPTGNRTRGKRMATIYFTTKPLAHANEQKYVKLKTSISLLPPGIVI